MLFCAEGCVDTLIVDFFATLTWHWLALIRLTAHAFETHFTVLTKRIVSREYAITLHARTDHTRNRIRALAVFRAQHSWPVRTNVFCAISAVHRLVHQLIGIHSRVDSVESMVLEVASKPVDDSRIQGVEERVGSVEGRVQEIGANSEDVDRRIVGCEARVDGVEAQVGEVSQSAVRASELSRLEEQVMEFVTRPSEGPSAKTLAGRVDRVEDAVEALRVSCVNEDRIERLEESHDDRALGSIIDDLAELPEPHSVSVTSEERDDLKRIRGIGAVLEGILNDKGIVSFAQIAALTVDEIESLSNDLKHFAGRVNRDRWVEQARALQTMKSA